MVPHFFWSCGSPFSAALLLRNVVKQPLFLSGCGSGFSAAFILGLWFPAAQRIIYVLVSGIFQPLFLLLSCGSLYACPIFSDASLPFLKICFCFGAGC